MLEPLTEPVYYQNAQWAVTGYGMEVVSSDVASICKDLIGEKRQDSEGQETYYDMPLHMAGKEWVDIELFLDAYSWALVHHVEATGLPVSLQCLLETFALARDMVACRRSR